MEPLKNLLTRNDCEVILQKSLKSSSSEITSFHLEKFQEDTAGFLGEHLKLTINLKSTKETYFVKTLPLFNTSQLHYVQDSGIFKKEALLYKNLLIDLLEIAPFGPKCYLVKDNLIVLDDLASQGFKMLDKRPYLNKERTYELLKSLAQLHASSLIYERKKGVRLDQEFKEELQECSFSFIEGKPRQKWLISTTKCVQNLIKLLDLQQYNIPEICEKFESIALKEMQEYISPSKKFRNVLIHDDLWCNNMLFNDENHCKFVDFQMARYVPPAFDFLLTLYLNLQTSEVEKDLEKYIDVYYLYFSELLKKHNLTTEELPKSEFKESLNYYYMAVLVESAMYGTHVYISAQLSDRIVQNLDIFEEFSFNNRTKYAIPEFQEGGSYKKRLVGPLTLLVRALAKKNSNPSRTQNVSRGSQTTY